MAARDAVLSQTPEFKDARILAYKNATALYDLITISLVRWGYIDVVLEVKVLFDLFLLFCTYWQNLSIRNLKSFRNQYKFI